MLMPVALLTTRQRCSGLAISVSISAVVERQQEWGGFYTPHFIQEPAHGAFYRVLKFWNSQSFEPGSQ